MAIAAASKANSTIVINMATLQTGGIKGGEVGWMIATTQKNAAFHAVQCVNPLVAMIGKMMNSVLGWVLTGFAKARLVYAIGENAGTKMIRSVVNGIGG